MFFQTENLPFSLLDHPTDQKQKLLFQSWREDDLSDAVIKYSADLVILTVDRKSGLPVELYRGENSLAAIVLGDNWQTDFVTASGAKQIMKAYEEIRFGEPTFQFVSHTGTNNQRRFDVSYERLVLPFKIGGGLQQFVTLSTLVSFETEPIDEQSRGSVSSPSHKASSQILLGREEFANSMRLESARSCGP